jgi:hypothetical protein
MEIFADIIIRILVILVPAGILTVFIIGLDKLLNINKK